jgi:hypothetical protein
MKNNNLFAHQARSKVNDHDIVSMQTAGLSPVIADLAFANNIDFADLLSLFTTWGTKLFTMLPAILAVKSFADVLALFQTYGADVIALIQHIVTLLNKKPQVAA